MKWGRRRASRSPEDAAAQTVTTVFLDVEGSSEIAERLGDDDWVAVLAAFERLVSDAVSRCGGTVVKSQGDGFMLVFPSARRALDCALQIRDAIANKNRSDWSPDLKVRMGVHTGEAIRVGSDFLGRSVIVAARIASEASGGEILVSQVTKDVIEGSNGFRFDEGRDFQLKGLRGVHRLFTARPRHSQGVVGLA